MTPRRAAWATASARLVPSRVGHLRAGRSGQTIRVEGPSVPANRVVRPHAQRRGCRNERRNASPCRCPGLRTTLVDVLLRKLVRNAALTDARKRSALTAFSGRRGAPSSVGNVHRLALDISSLMVLGWLGILRCFPGNRPAGRRALRAIRWAPAHSDRCRPFAPGRVHAAILAVARQICARGLPTGGRRRSNNLLKIRVNLSGTGLATAARAYHRDHADPARAIAPAPTGDLVMGIFDALTTAVTGLQSQSYALQNISGNIANSQTTAFKRTDTSFADLVTDNVPTRQVAGAVEANSRSTNNIQGSLQASSVGTYMAIQGSGYFVVQQPTGANGNVPIFGGGNLFTRRGDFQTDKNGFLVNGAGYYLMGIPIDPTSGSPTSSVPQVLQFNNNFLSAQATTQIQYSATLASNPITPFTKSGVLGTELLNPAYFESNPLAVPTQPARIIGAGATLLPDASASVTGTTDISVLPTGGVTGTVSIKRTNID